MEPQEIFNKVATHLFTQGEQARNDTACLYRAKDNKKCAVGCLIPDEMYIPEMECGPVIILISTSKGCDFLIPDYFEKNRKLLSDLQLAHDIAANWKHEAAMKDFLQSVAFDKYNNLDASILDTLHFPEKTA